MYYQIEAKASRPYRPSKEMARYIAGVRYDRLPPEAIHAAKRAVLDLLGAALAGYALADIAPPVLTFLKGRGGAPMATLWGDGERVPVEMAAFWAATVGHALELDDGHREGAAHIGTVVVPAALCLGEFLGASGRDVLAAVVAGYEVMGRVAAGINPTHFLRGFHTTGCTGSFGAVAASGVLLGLDQQQALGALGTAGVQFAGLLEVIHTGQMVKGLHAGRAAEAGVMAARLATMGVRGPEEILEGPKGYVHAMTDKVDWDRMLDGLGKGTPEILKAYTKPYPTCRHCHPAIDMALAIHREVGPLRPDQVNGILVRTYSVAIHEVGQIKHPRTNQEAKFSAPWAIACALILGQMGLAQTQDAVMQDAALQGMALKARFDLDPARDAEYPHRRGAELTVELADGRRLVRSVALPKGEPELALPDAEMEAKFSDLAGRALRPERVREIAAAVWSLDRMDDVRALARSLAAR